MREKINNYAHFRSFVGLNCLGIGPWWGESPLSFEHLFSRNVNLQTAQFVINTLRWVFITFRIFITGYLLWSLLRQSYLLQVWKNHSSKLINNNIRDNARTSLTTVFTDKSLRASTPNSSALIVWTKLCKYSNCFGDSKGTIGNGGLKITTRWK